MLSANTSGDSSNDTVEAALKRLVDRYGMGLLRESQRLKGLLQDECPQARREISVLLQALDDNVPQDLMRVRSGEPLEALAPRLAQRLSEEKALAPEASRWAVRVWAQGLGVAAPPPADAGSGGTTPAVMVTDMNSGNVVPFAASHAGGMPGGSDMPGAAGGTGAGVSAPATSGIAGGTPAGSASAPLSGAASGTAAPPGWMSQPTPGTPSNPAAWESARPEVTPAWTGGAAAATGAGQQSAANTSRPRTKIVPFLLAAAVAAAAGAGVWWWVHQPELHITGVSTRDAFVADGRPHEVTIDFSARHANVQSVEVRFVRGDAKPGRDSWNVPVPPDATAQGQASAGALSYRSSHPVTATYAYVLVNEDGTRSAPFEKTFEIPAAPVRTAPAHAAGMGTVVAIKEIEHPGEGTGIGAAIGGVAGAVVGHQGGKGRGKDVATALGAVAGAVAGHFTEKKVRSETEYEVSVRMDDGSTQVIHQASAAGLRTGARVRVGNGVAVAASP